MDSGGKTEYATIPSKILDAGPGEISTQGNVSCTGRSKIGIILPITRYKQA